MRWAIVGFACAVMLAASPAPARAAPLNGQLAAVVDGRLVTLNADGTRPAHAVGAARRR